MKEGIEDEYDPEILDQHLVAQVQLPLGDDLVLGKVKTVLSNLTTLQFQALSSLAKNKNIIIKATNDTAIYHMEDIKTTLKKLLPCTSACHPKQRQPTSSRASKYNIGSKFLWAA